MTHNMYFKILLTHTASITALYHHLGCPGFSTQNSEFSVASKSLVNKSGCDMLLGRIHMHIPQHMKVVKHCCVFGIDVGRILIGSTASITVLQHHLLPKSYPEI